MGGSPHGWCLCCDDQAEPLVRGLRCQDLSGFPLGLVRCPRRVRAGCQCLGGEVEEEKRGISVCYVHFTEPSSYVYRASPPNISCIPPNSETSDLPSPQGKRSGCCSGGGGTVTRCLQEGKGGGC